MAQLAEVFQKTGKGTIGLIEVAPGQERQYGIVKGRRLGPRLSLLYLLNELTGRPDDRSAYLNLSDGGHFDNIGLYELVRRRCRYIIIGDAEQDPGLNFGS